MAGKCLDQLNCNVEILTGKCFSIADVVALDAVNSGEMKIFSQDSPRAQEKTGGVHKQRLFRRGGISFFAGPGNPGNWTTRGDADVDLIRELSVEAHVLDLRDCPECGLHLLKVNGEDVAAFAQAGCRQGFLTGEDSVEIEGDAPQGVFGILEEKPVERRLKPEKRRCADCGNEEKIGDPADDCLSPSPPAG